MKRYLFHTIVVFVASIALKVNAATYPSLKFEKIKVDGEFYNEEVKHSIQDSQGFIWFATFDGLIRYDGYTIRRFNHDPKIPHSVSSDRTMVLFEDSKNMLWVGTLRNGINQFDPRTETFKRYTFDLTTNSQILNIYEDSLGIIWVSTWDDGLIRLDPDSGNFTQYLPDKNQSNTVSTRQIWKVIEDRDVKGNLWVATSNGLDYFDRSAESFHHNRPSDNDPTRISQRIVLELYYDADDVLWIGTFNGLNKYIAETKSFQRYYPDQTKANLGTDENRVNSIYESSNGKLFIGTEGGGIKLFDRVTNRFKHYRHDPSNPFSLRDNLIERHGLFEDDSGILWVVTAVGMNKLNLATMKVKNYRNELNNPSSLSGNIVWSVYEDKLNRIWAGTDENGLNLFDKSKQRFINFRHQPDNPTSLNSNRVYSILFDKDETLWVGTNIGLNRLDKGEVEFKHYNFVDNKANDSSSNRIYTLQEDKQGNIWIGTTRGIRKYNKNKDEFIHFMPEEGNPKSLSSQWIRTLFIDKQDRVWVGTAKGLDMLEPDSTEFVHFPSDPNNPESISNNHVFSIQQTRDNYLWVGTYGGGLNRLDPSTNKFKRYGKKHGLNSNTIYGMLEDEKGFLWISSDIGLSRLNRNTERFYNFNPADGFQAFGYNNNSSSVKLENGELLFAGELGFDQFDPSDFNEQIKMPTYDVTLTDLLVYNKSVPLASSLNHPEPDYESKSYSIENSISYLDSITLTHKEFMFSFEFTVLNYLRPNDVQYAYKLDGFNEDWITTNANKRFATYMNIPAGEYEFQVKATSIHDQFKNEYQTIKITVLPPIWLTWWAKVSYVALGVVMLFSLYYLRTASLRKRALELQQTVNERTQELTKEKSIVEYQSKELAQEKQVVEQLLSKKMEEFSNVSHEFRTPLTLILGNTQSLLNEQTNGVRDKLTVIKRNGNRLARMVEQLLHMERFKVQNAVTRSPHAIKPIIELIAQSFKEALKNKSIQFHLGQIDDASLLLTPDTLENILMNLLSNAMKYTQEGGRIEITAINQPNNQIELSVKDTGIGIPEDKHEQIFKRYQRIESDNSDKVMGSGIGLALVKELVEAHGGYIELESEVGKGTVFKVYLEKLSSEIESIEQTQSQQYNTELVNLEIENLYKQEQIADTQTLIDPSTEASEGKPLVLIIEDNLDMRSYIAEILSKDYQLIMADDGEQGIELAVQRVPDFIISDIMMPKMNGYEVANQLKANDITSHIPIVLLTAKGDRESRILGWKENVDDYLTKPFDAQELQIRIANLLSIRELLRKRYSENILTGVQRIEQKPKDSSLTKVEQEKEAKFLQKLEDIVAECYEDSDFKISKVAERLAMSERQFYRKLKAILNLTPSQYLSTYRLQKSAELLTEGHPISHIAYDCGFTSQSYFSRCFRAKFGCTPTDYIVGK